MIDQIMNHNKTFVAQKGYEKYITDKSIQTRNWLCFLAWTQDLPNFFLQHWD